VGYFQNTCLIRPNNYFLLQRSQAQLDEVHSINNEKYTIVKIWPIKINGVSTGRAPIHVNKIIVLRRVHKIICLTG